MLRRTVKKSKVVNRKSRAVSKSKSTPRTSSTKSAPSSKYTYTSFKRVYASFDAKTLFKNPTFKRTPAVKSLLTKMKKDATSYLKRSSARRTLQKTASAKALLSIK